MATLLAEAAATAAGMAVVGMLREAERATAQGVNTPGTETHGDEKEKTEKPSQEL